MEKLEKIPAWQMDKERSKKDVILEAQKEKRKVHFASLMDFCHLKTAELEPKHQKYKGRVVLRGHSQKRLRCKRGIHRTRIVTLASDCCKIKGCYCEITRMRWTSRRRSIRLHPGKNGGRSEAVKNTKVRMSKYIHFHRKLKQLFFLGGVNFLCSYSFWRRSNYFSSN